MSAAGTPYIVLETAGSQRYDLTKSEVSLGRSPENDIRLEQPNVSRFHAQITRQGPFFLLSDLGSANGTLVNGARIQGTIELSDGDRVECAGVAVTFHSGRATAAAPSPSPHTDREEIAPEPQFSAQGRQTAEAALEGEGGEQVQIVKGETLVGRVPGNDLVLPDTYVSRQHARIQNVNGQFIVTDLGSSNGTYINGHRLSEAHALQPGEEIIFGRTPFIFRAVSPSAPRGAVAAFPVPQFSAALGNVSIQVEDVHKNYQSGDGSVPVLRGVSLQIREGEFVSLVGPSGSGKSTLINMMTGIDYPDAGSITVAGQRIGDLNENKLARWRGNNVGLIFQFFQLLPTLTAIENVMLPMDFCGRYASSKRRGRALECLALVGMDTFADRLPSAMSGGQQQRVAIARALANDPPIIIGDEPTGNLDSATAQQIFSLLAQLAQQGKTVAIVTHDPLLARSTPRKIEILDGQVIDSAVAAQPLPAAAAAGRG